MTRPTRPGPGQQPRARHARAPKTPLAAGRAPAVRGVAFPLSLRGGGERGSASIQMVVLLPALFAVMFLGMQAALIYHARSLAIASAQEGARAAGAENGTEPAARRGGR